MWICSNVAKQHNPAQANPSQPSPSQPRQPSPGLVETGLVETGLVETSQAPNQQEMIWHMIYPCTKTQKIWDLLEIHHFHHNLAVPPGGCVFTLFKYEVDKFNLANRFPSDGAFFLKNRGFLLISRNSAFFTIFLAKPKQKPMIFNDESMVPSKSSTYVSINPCMHRTAFVGRPCEFDVFLFKALLTME